MLLYHSNLKLLILSHNVKFPCGPLAVAILQTQEVGMELLVVNIIMPDVSNGD